MQIAIIGTKYALELKIVIPRILQSKILGESSSCSPKRVERKQVDRPRIACVNSGDDDWSERVTAGILAGQATAIAEAIRYNLPLVIWRDGKVVEVPPESFQLPKE